MIIHCSDLQVIWRSEDVWVTYSVGSWLVRVGYMGGLWPNGRSYQEAAGPRCWSGTLDGWIWMAGSDICPSVTLYILLDSHLLSYWILSQLVIFEYYDSKWYYVPEDQKLWNSFDLSAEWNWPDLIHLLTGLVLVVVMLTVNNNVSKCAGCACVSESDSDAVPVSASKPITFSHFCKHTLHRQWVFEYFMIINCQTCFCFILLWFAESSSVTPHSFFVYKLLQFVRINSVHLTIQHQTGPSVSFDVCGFKIMILMKAYLHYLF